MNKTDVMISAEDWLKLQDATGKANTIANYSDGMSRDDIKKYAREIIRLVDEVKDNV